MERKRKHDDSLGDEPRLDKPTVDAYLDAQRKFYAALDGMVDLAIRAQSTSKLRRAQKLRRDAIAALDTADLLGA